MIYDSVAQVAPAISQQIAQSNRILILTHINPDGDAIGSALAMWHALRGLGKSAIPLIAPPAPEYAVWLPGADAMEYYQRGMTFPDVDLVILVDTASLARIGTMVSEFERQLGELPLIVIDHHVTNVGPGTHNLIMPSAASTCELLYCLFCALEVPISPALATCLLMGITTDTQSYQTSATTSESLRIAADLVDLGADHQRVVREVYFAMPYGNAALIGQALSAMRSEDGIAWTTVSRAMLLGTGADDEATDDVVRMMQRISRVQVVVLFREREDGTTKISLRSQPPLNVAVLAQRWGGGGHAQAAGATLTVAPALAELEVLPLLRELLSAGS